MTFLCISMCRYVIINLIINWSEERFLFVIMREHWPLNDSKNEYDLFNCAARIYANVNNETW